MRKEKAAKNPAAKRPEADPDAEAEADRDLDEGETEASSGRTNSATDNVGDISIEVNVEDLIAQIESESKSGPAPDGSARRKIEDILENKRVAREIMDFDDFDISD